MALDLGCICESLTPGVSSVDVNRLSDQDLQGRLRPLQLSSMTNAFLEPAFFLERYTTERPYTGEALGLPAGSVAAPAQEPRTTQNLSPYASKGDL